MSADSEHVRFLLDLLAPLGPVEPRRLFGTTSFVMDGLVFALAYEEKLYLKVDDITRPEFMAADQEPFQYSRQGRLVALNSYYTMPDAAYDEPEDALDWARRGLEAALRVQAAKRPKRSRVARPR